MSPAYCYDIATGHPVRRQACEFCRAKISQINGKINHCTGPDKTSGGL